MLKWRNRLDYQNQPKIASWGLQVWFAKYRAVNLRFKVNTRMVQLKARILPPPKVLYASNEEARPKNGSWNVRDQRVS